MVFQIGAIELREEGSSELHVVEGSCKEKVRKEKLEKRVTIMNLPVMPWPVRGST